MERERIGRAKQFLMVSVASLFDFVQLPVVLLGLIPFFTIFTTLASTLIVSTAALTFYLWFAISDVSFLSNVRALKRLFYFAGTIFIEILPLPIVDLLSDTFPFITLGVFMVTVHVRREDKQKRNTYNNEEGRPSFRAVA